MTISLEKSQLFKPRENFGDNLNRWLYNFYTGEYLPKEKYCLIGSILGRLGGGRIVWGSGFEARDKKFKKIPPKQILAVRGKLTGARVKELGFDDPGIYGDPALFLPEIYPEDHEIKYQLGWINHKRDKRTFKHPGIVNINPKAHSPKEYLDLMLSCKMIASSSLHGCIVADAYQIPNIWVYFDDVPRFKYDDYYSAVDMKTDPHYIPDDPGKFIKYAQKYTDTHSLPCLERLRHVRPF